METKQALEELNLYRKNQKLMFYIRNRLAELEQRKYSLGGGDGAVIDGGKNQQEDKLVSLIDQIEKNKLELLDVERYGLCLQNDIERKIYKLREPYCTILRGYYCEAKSLERLAVEYNYTFDSVKSIRYRGIKLYAKLPPLYAVSST